MINFGFDSAFSIDENGNMVIPYPNLYSKELYEFDIDVYKKKYDDLPIKNNQINEYDYLFLNGRSICFNLNNDLYSYNQDTFDNYISRGENFIYSIIIWNNKLFDDNSTNIVLPEKIKEQIKLGNCKFVIFYITEPWFMYEYCYKWLSNFAKENKLKKEDIILVSSNLDAPNVMDGYVTSNVIENNFTIIGFNYFFHRIWFFPHRFHEHYSSKIYQEKLNETLNKQKETKKEKHFLCFNRKPHDHRVAIFAEVMTNPKLKNKTIVTLGRENLIGGQIHKDAIRRFIDKSYKHGHKRLYDFIDTYDSNKDYIYDIDDLDNEQSHKINLDAHYKTFCNIVTETLTAENLLFFSEKIIKPIFTLQPFIIIGNRGSLRKLKEYGFKTFDKWWDESYDELKNQNRFERIVEIMEEISLWDDNKINKTLEEMQEVLVHNFNMLIEDKSTTSFFNEFNKITNNLIKKKLI